jgi:DNA-binding NarL/FixJ family response regulator
MGTGNRGVVRLALVDDYEVVLTGLAHMFDRYRDRIEIADIAADEPVSVDVDVALFDTFAQGEVDHDDFAVLVAHPLVRRAAVYTWAFDPALIDIARRLGAAGYLSKTMTAEELVDAIERIDGGEVVVSERPARRTSSTNDWPGRNDGLTEREAEIMALITQGKTNLEIAALTYLSVNSIKTHIRNAYRKAGVTSRAQAVLWGVDHGLKLEQRAIDRWRR